MFTGIIEEMGQVVTLRQTAGRVELVVQARRVLEGTRHGDSIAINGVCLTVTDRTNTTFTVELQPETLRRTNLGDLASGAAVNLERALAVGDRLGGHFVQGHVDGTGVLRAITSDGPSLVVSIEAPKSLLRYIVPKGFIAVDGVSLTVVEVTGNIFTVALVTYTQEAITLPKLPIGSRVNLEVDILGKYVERILLAGGTARETINATQLAGGQGR
jgi:riboflavin synthase